MTQANKIFKKTYCKIDNGIHNKQVKYMTTIIKLTDLQ